MFYRGQYCNETQSFKIKRKRAIALQKIRENVDLQERTFIWPINIQKVLNSNNNQEIENKTGRYYVLLNWKKYEGEPWD